MHTYLPSKEKRELRKEYLIRLMIVFFGALLAITVCTIIFMLPAYFSSYAERNQVLVKLQSFKDTGASTEIKGIENEVKSVTDITNRFAEGIDRPNSIDVIDLATSALVPGVSLKGFEYTYTASSSVDVRVTGLAQTRDALINFKKKVESNSYVAKVELPVSDLAKSRDLTFIMRIISK